MKTPEMKRPDFYKRNLEIIKDYNALKKEWEKVKLQIGKVDYIFPKLTEKYGIGQHTLYYTLKKYSKCIDGKK